VHSHSEFAVLPVCAPPNLNLKLGLGLTAKTSGVFEESPKGDCIAWG
jgi:hypothetical protein